MHNEDSEDDNLATFTLSGGRNAEYSITATQRQNFSKTTGISTGITGTDTVVVNRCHAQALLTTSHGALGPVFVMT